MSDRSFGARSLLSAACVAAFSLLALPAAGQDQATSADKLAGDAAADRVVAIVNGEEIRNSDVLKLARTLPAQYQSQLALIFPALLERAIDLQLLVNAGREAGLSDDAEVKRRVADAEAEAIRRVYLEREIAKGISDEALREAYETYKIENPAKPEIKARHILVAEEAEAVAIIEELDGGADFAALAKERSIGPSGPNGGDLGFFSEDQMVEAFSTAAFVLEPGTYTAAPVQSQYGWHVILVEERRDATAKTFEEVETELREQLTQTAVRDLVTQLRSEAKIEVVGASGDSPAAE